jgi:tetratricopeptide (TPR) repeat protein
MKNTQSTKILLLFIAAFVFLGVFPSPGFSQETVLRGFVHDEQGNPLPNVKITLLDPSRGTRFVLNSNKKGEFMKIGIPPALYRMSFELEGYFPFESQHNISFDAGEKLSVSLKKIPPKIDDDKDFIGGLDLFKEGKYAEAIASFQKTVERFPESIEALYNLGVSYLRNGNPKDAIGVFERAIQLRPDTVEVHFALGECYFLLNQSEKALEAFSKATDLKPQDAKGYYNLGMIYYKYNKTEEALDFLEQAIKLDPKFSSAYYQAGLVSIKKGDLAKAIQFLEDFLKMEPNAPEVNQVKAMIEELKKRKS